MPQTKTKLVVFGRPARITQGELAACFEIKRALDTLMSALAKRIRAGADVAPGRYTVERSLTEILEMASTFDGLDNGGILISIDQPVEELLEATCH